MRADDRRIPLTVVGGFLGAGKTTLVNRLLTQARGRTAVLVNDFGAVNVDAGLILAHDGETLRLTNGCVCCSMSDDFMTTLIRVLDAPDPFDAIVIEASGVGDPWAIAEIALVEPQLTLHAVIVLADAERLCALLDDPRLGDTVERQVRAADLLLLNKMDLVDEGMRVEASARLDALKPGLPIVPTVAAALPEALLPESSLDESSLDETSLQVSATSVVSRGPSLAPAADHESQFHRVLYRRRDSFDRDRLECALRDLPTSLLRLKGFCAVGSEISVLQLVGARWSLTATTPRAGEAWAIELVGIALDALTAERVASRLDAALAQDSHRQPRALPVGDDHPFTKHFEA